VDLQNELKVEGSKGKEEGDLQKKIEVLEETVKKLES